MLDVQKHMVHRRRQHAMSNDVLGSGARSQFVRAAIALAGVALFSSSENDSGKIKKGMTDNCGNQAAASAPELAGNRTEDKRGHGCVGTYHQMDTSEQQSYQK
jgi:hypothetical protein